MVCRVRHDHVALRVNARWDFSPDGADPELGDLRPAELSVCHFCRPAQRVATLLRRKYYITNSHAGVIMYMSDAAQDQEDVNNIRRR